MKISKLLEQNKFFVSEQSLSQNFGDAYLCKNNNIYSRIRKQTLQLGFKFSNEKNDLYEALPLSQLESVLRSQKIPYLDNVSVLAQIDQQIKGGAIWDEVSDNLKKNHVFHESCHAVSRSISSPFFKNKLSAQEKRLMVLMEESFSNTCELLAVCDASDAIHKIFFEWNSYICMFDQRSNLNSTIQLMGKEFIFRFMFLSYLHANFLKDRLDDKSFEKILNILNADLKTEYKNLKALRSIAKIAFELNPRFREVTTSFYFRMQGYSEPLEQLLNFDFMKIIDEKRDFKEFLFALSRAVLD